jgi:NAD(P)-dependent dehydrogenase (short-subunit alcohol dehydrogenase family)
MVRIAGSSILITGANRGIGRALVEEALKRGAGRVYAGTRRPLEHADERVTPLMLDVTDAEQRSAAAERAGSLDILVNNAGVAGYDDLTDRSVLEHHLAVNLFGTYGMTEAFVPHLTRSRGALVPNVSVTALAPLTLIASYSLSKAALFSLTQSARALLADRGISVHAVLTGVVDTDMTRNLDAPKAPAPDVARAILDGVERGEEEIFPDPMARTLADGWPAGAAKTLERQYAELAKQVRAAAPGPPEAA